jgi:hypothetical protein
MRPFRLPPLVAACALVLPLPAFAGPPTTFPTTYACTSVARERVTASAAGRTVTRRFRFDMAGPVTFLDDRTLSIETGDPEFPDGTAKYRTTRKGVVRYTMSRETRRDFLALFRRQMRKAGLRGTPTAAFGTGRIEFSEDGSTLEGSQSLRLGFAGTYRGIGVTATGSVRFTFSGALAP